MNLDHDKKICNDLRFIGIKALPKKIQCTDDNGNIYGEWAFKSWVKENQFVSHPRSLAHCVFLSTANNAV